MTTFQIVLTSIVSFLGLVLAASITAFGYYLNERRKASIEQQKVNDAKFENLHDHIKECEGEGASLRAKIQQLETAVWQSIIAAELPFVMWTKDFERRYLTSNRAHTDKWLGPAGLTFPDIYMKRMSDIPQLAFAASIFNEMDDEVRGFGFSCRTGIRLYENSPDSWMAMKCRQIDATGTTSYVGVACVMRTGVFAPIE